MKLIVGLGNHGEKYEKTRHNIGFMVIDEVAREFTPVSKTVWINEQKTSSWIIHLPKKDLILAKPQTMMNASGFAVKKLITEYCILNTDLWVVHDDLDLPLGKIKIVKGHGSAGHHGIDSLVEQLGTADFVRFRVGIGHPEKAGEWQVGGGRLVSKKAKRHDVMDYVLEEFFGKDTVEARKVIKRTVEVIKFALEKGIEEVMNRYNS